MRANLPHHGLLAATLMAAGSLCLGQTRPIDPATQPVRPGLGTAAADAARLAAQLAANQRDDANRRAEALARENARLNALIDRLRQDIADAVATTSAQRDAAQRAERDQVQSQARAEALEAQVKRAQATSDQLADARRQLATLSDQLTQRSAQLDTRDRDLAQSNERGNAAQAALSAATIRLDAQDGARWLPAAVAAMLGLAVGGLAGGLVMRMRARPVPAAGLTAQPVTIGVSLGEWSFGVDRATGWSPLRIQVRTQWIPTGSAVHALQALIVDTSRRSMSGPEITS